MGPEPQKDSGKTCMQRTGDSSEFPGHCHVVGRSHPRIGNTPGLFAVYFATAASMISSDRLASFVGAAHGLDKS